MEIEDQLGVRIAFVDVQEALTCRWHEYQSELDLVRVRQPEPEAWIRLEAAGFAVKPAWLTWLMPTPADVSGYVRQLPKDVRRSFRRGIQYCESASVRFELTASPERATLDRFLGLYEKVINEMDRGVLFATENRMALLDQLDTTVILLAFRGSQLIGGSLWQAQKQQTMLYVRFNVVEQQERQHYLTWAMYFRAFEYARSTGFTTLVFGRDPNLYGHIGRTGLFCFKYRLGFRPVPSELFATRQDEADLILRLDALADPSFMVCYDLGRPPERFALPQRQICCPALRGELVCHRPESDPKMFHADFLTEVRLRPIGTPSGPSRPTLMTEGP